MENGILVSKRRVKRARSAEGYWTKKKMRNAIPIPLRRVPGNMERTAESETRGKSRVVQAVRPRSARRHGAVTTEVSNMGSVPFSFVGKLFMREGRNDYVGSAWVIGNHAIFSAAHCLFDDNGSFFDDVVFQPQYRNGDSAGVFAVIQSAVDNRYPDFERGEFLKYDMGIGLLDKPIGDLTGTAGYALYPKNQISIGEVVRSIGYPAEGSFYGKKMFQSVGEIVKDDDPGSNEERNFGAENDMTGGCSGGPWVNNGNIAVGLNSFVYTGEYPKVMYSPYFGRGFENLVNWAKDNGGMKWNDERSRQSSSSDDSTDFRYLRRKLNEAKEILEDIESRIR